MENTKKTIILVVITQHIFVFSLYRFFTIRYEEVTAPKADNLEQWEKATDFAGAAFEYIHQKHYKNMMCFKHVLSNFHDLFLFCWFTFLFLQACRTSSDECWVDAELQQELVDP